MGGDGADDLDGGASSDIFDAGTGADTVRARDGEVDAITCGDDDDTFYSDDIDTVTGCESVNPDCRAAAAAMAAAVATGGGGGAGARRQRRNGGSGAGTTTRRRGTATPVTLRSRRV